MLLGMAGIFTNIKTVIYATEIIRLGYKLIRMLRFDNTIFIFCSHVASTAAGNYGVPVVVNGFNYGRASGMAPRARYWSQNVF